MLAIDKKQLYALRILISVAALLWFWEGRNIIAQSDTNLLTVMGWESSILATLVSPSAISAISVGTVFLLCVCWFIFKPGPGFVNITNEASTIKVGESQILVYYKDNKVKKTAKR